MSASEQKSDLSGADFSSAELTVRPSVHRGARLSESYSTRKLAASPSVRRGALSWSKVRARKPQFFCSNAEIIISHLALTSYWQFFRLTSRTILFSIRSMFFIFLANPSSFPIPEGDAASFLVE